MASKTYTLKIETKSGSYMHKIVFKPLGDIVEVTENMIDHMFGGSWTPNQGTRKMSLEAAREYYKDRRKFGYR